MDPYFRVEVISQTPNPQRTAWLAAHQDYSEGFVWDEWQKQLDDVDYSHGGIEFYDSKFTEEYCGEMIVKHLLAGHRGHFGPLEHPQIVLNAGWFPHSTMQQLRTHRHLSFDCQSGRYTGKRIVQVVENKRDIEEVFYFRPLGQYTDRNGKKYEYTANLKRQDIEWCRAACAIYADRIDDGFSEEHARSMIPFDIRQHWVVSMNLRSLMHILAVRGKRDAQLECQQFCELVLPHFKAWTPQVYEWFEQNLWLKARLAP